jgi:hypothetical protein
LAGVTFELELFKQLSVEANALHRNLYLERKFEFPDGRSDMTGARRAALRWAFDGPYPRIATNRDQIELLTGIRYASSPE